MGKIGIRVNKNIARTDTGLSPILEDEMPRILTAAVLGLIILTPLFVLASPDDAKINEKKIYYGDPDDFEKPGVIRIVKVFNAIPEYKEAKKKPPLLEKSFFPAG